MFLRGVNVAWLALNQFGGGSSPPGGTKERKACLDNKPKGTPIDGPAHYKGYDVLEIINRYNLGFELGNVIKYILRAENKGKYLSDLKKAQFYLNWFIDRCEGENDGKV